jgi:hypothetical protein
MANLMIFFNLERYCSVNGRFVKQVFKGSSHTPEGSFRLHPFLCYRRLRALSKPDGADSTWSVHEYLRKSHERHT